MRQLLQHWKDISLYGLKVGATKGTSAAIPRRKINRSVWPCTDMEDEDASRKFIRPPGAKFQAKTEVVEMFALQQFLHVMYSSSAKPET
jgi:hypothetical protein